MQFHRSGERGGNTRGRKCTWHPRKSNITSFKFITGWDRISSHFTVLDTVNRAPRRRSTKNWNTKDSTKVSPSFSKRLLETRLEETRARETASDQPLSTVPLSDFQCTVKFISTDVISLRLNYYARLTNPSLPSSPSLSFTVYRLTLPPVYLDLS